MNNQFRNFIEFVNIDEAIKAKNLNHPIAKLKKYTAQVGDFWRLLIEKSTLATDGLDQIEARIVMAENTEGSWVFTDTEKKAKIRKQITETYTQFSILVNGFSTLSKYSQFALLRTNGDTVLGTVSEVASAQDEYLHKIKRKYESYEYAKVLARKNGSLLEVRVFNNAAFRLDDEEVTVGIGEVTAKNTNSPSILFTSLGTVSYATQNSWKVNVSSVEQGNIFELNGVTYEAQKGDTVQSVISALLAGQSRLIIEAATSFTVLASNGSRTIVNSNTPSLELSYLDTASSNDRYAISVGSSIKSGNLYQIQATGQTPRTFKATDTSTVADVKAALATSGVYYTVPTGTVPVWSALSSTQEIANTNNPQLFLSDLVVIPSATKDKYRIVIGSDVQKGNVFKLNDKTIVAQNGDTADSVGVKLGLAASVDTIEVAEDTTMNVFAVPGNRYGQDDITDVQIVEQPNVKRAAQLVLEVDFTGLLVDKDYCIQLFNPRTETVLGYSNLVRVDTVAEDTCMVEVADEGLTCGYEYCEMLTQRMRLPIYLRTPTQRTSENRMKMIDGGYERNSTAIEDARTLVTRAESFDFHKSLTIWLKHQKVWIDGKPYYCEGEYNMMVLSELSKSVQATALLVSQNEHNNKSRFYSGSTKPVLYEDVILRGDCYSLRVEMQNLSFESVVIGEGFNSVKIAEYEVTIDNDGDARLVRIAPNGYVDRVCAVPSRSRVRLRSLVRVEKGKPLTLFCERSTDLSVTDSTKEVENSAFTVVSYSQEKETLLFSSFSDDFGTDFNI